MLTSNQVSRICHLFQQIILTKSRLNRYGYFRITNDGHLFLQKKNLKKTAVVMDAIYYQNVVVIDYTMVLAANTRMSVLTVMIVETEGHALMLKPLHPLGSSAIVS